MNEIEAYKNAPRETPVTAECYREYLRLGIARSYETLHERLVELWGEEHAPAATTLRNWGSKFGWTQRVREDDQLINARALERMKDKLASEAEDRRRRRLTLADIQLNAATRAMLRDDPESGQKIPIDIVKTNPQIVRAINDTARAAGETMRQDSGVVLQRVGAEGIEDGEVSGEVRVMGNEALEELGRFIGLDEERADVPDNEEDENIPEEVP